MIKLSKTIILLLLSISCVPAFACVCIVDYERPMQMDDLKIYDFIALVSVTGEKDIKPKDPAERPSRKLLSIQVLEHFKGKNFTEIIENDINSSCDMGVEKGEEWVIFAILSNGKPAISACHRNVQFKDKDGKRDWKYRDGFRQIDELRALFGHVPKRKPDGKNTAYYPNGKIEMEENYAGGVKNGARAVYYPNGVVYGKENFVNDSLQGESTWYFPSGQLALSRHFARGRPRNVTRAYYDSTIDQSYKKLLIQSFYKTEDSMRFVHQRIQVHYETVFDSFGREVAFRKFSRLGKLESESIYNNEPNASIHIYYHPNGNVSSISYLKDNKSYGHYEGYDESGALSKSWDYDPNGIQIKSSIWIRH